jgi:hypothetical protein
MGLERDSGNLRKRRSEKVSRKNRGRRLLSKQSSWNVPQIKTSNINIELARSLVRRRINEPMDQESWCGSWCLAKIIHIAILFVVSHSCTKSSIKGLGSAVIGYCRATSRPPPVVRFSGFPFARESQRKSRETPSEQYAAQVMDPWWVR